MVLSHRREHRTARSDGLGFEQTKGTIGSHFRRIYARHIVFDIELVDRLEFSTVVEADLENAFVLKSLCTLPVELDTDGHLIYNDVRIRFGGG